MGTRTTLDRLTSLRAAAALGVFLVHLSQYDVWRLPLNLSSEGYVGVGFFFTLSGFILVIAAPASDRPRAFYRRRFARIYPAYLTMVIVALVVPVVAASRGPLELLTSVTLTQSWVPASNSIVYGVNAVSWSLSCEAAFYAVLPFALAWLMTKGRRFRWSFAVCWYLVAAAISVAAVRSHMQFATTAVYVSPVVRFGEFALGLVAGLEIAEGWRPRIPIGAVLALLAVLTVGTSQAHIPSPLPDFAFDPLFLALIVSAAVLDLTGAPGLLTRRSLIYAGQVSFCFYLVHQLIIANLRPVLTGSGLFDALLLFLAACAGAATLHHLVELPAQRLLRGRQRRPPADEFPPATTSGPITA
ncbi:MAG TPA: acyltransferase [Solirubrobacteraceae bacterium]